MESEEEVRIRGDGGWPLGLILGTRIIEHLPLSSHFISTPSLTSSPSSSDLDTQSTGSFFPEKSTTLGSLMGHFSSNSFCSPQQHHHHHLQQQRGPPRSCNSRRIPLRSLLLCERCSDHNDSTKVISPSLVPLRKRVSRNPSHRTTTTATATATNSNYDLITNNRGHGETIVEVSCNMAKPPEFILEHTSPSSLYPSGDWIVSIPTGNMRSGHHRVYHTPNGNKIPCNIL